MADGPLRRNAMQGTRLVLRFDDSNFEGLKRVTRTAGFPTVGATMQAALKLIGTLQKYAEAGQTEIIVRNPRTGDTDHIDCRLVAHGNVPDDSDG
jgi:hypothetical protein